MFRRTRKSGLLAAIMGLFGVGFMRHSVHVPTGNRSLPPDIQQEIQTKAQAKRERKMARPQGWYNG